MAGRAPLGQVVRELPIRAAGDAEPRRGRLVHDLEIESGLAGEAAAREIVALAGEAGGVAELALARESGGEEALRRAGRRARLLVEVVPGHAGETLRLPGPRAGLAPGEAGFADPRRRVRKVLVRAPVETGGAEAEVVLPARLALLLRRPRALSAPEVAGLASWE